MAKLLYNSLVLLYMNENTLQSPAYFKWLKLLFCLGNKHVAEILLKNGANVNANDSTNNVMIQQTPLHLAAINGKIFFEWK